MLVSVAAPPGSVGVLELRLEFPTTNVDGTPLYRSEIVKVRVHYSTASPVTESDPYSDFPPGETLQFGPPTNETYYFAVKVQDSHGNWSPLSNELSGKANDVAIPATAHWAHSVGKEAVFTDNSPSSGSVAWSNVVLYYRGEAYVVADGNTDKRYVWWDFDYPTQFQTSDDVPDLAKDDVIIGYNDNGTWRLMIYRPMVMADYIRAGVLQSTNWGASEGSLFDLEKGEFKLGGSDDPRLAFYEDPVAGWRLDIRGNVTIEGGTGVSNLADAGSLAMEDSPLRSPDWVTNLQVSSTSLEDVVALARFHLTDSEVAYLHEFLCYKGKLYGCTRQRIYNSRRERFVRFDPHERQVASAEATPNVVWGIEDIVASREHDKLWAISYIPSFIIEVNPDTLASTDKLEFPGSYYGGVLCWDGEHLWAGLRDSAEDAAKILKIDVGDWTYETYTIADSAGFLPHAKNADRDYVYWSLVNTSTGCSKVVKMKKSDGSYAVLDVPEILTDDMAFDGAHLYCATEGTPAKLYVIDVSGDTPQVKETIEFPPGKGPSYAVRMIGDYVWVAFYTSPASVAVVDPRDLSYDFFEVEGYDHVNEIATDGHNVFFATWEDPAKLVSWGPPEGSLSAVWRPGPVGTPPTGAGLYIGSDYLGFFDGGQWKTYMDDSGHLFCDGTNGHLRWDPGTDTLEVKGSVVVEVATDGSNKASIRSANYVPGVSGWQIDSEGDAEFNNVTVRGSIITGSGSDINADYISTGTLTAIKVQTASSGARVALETSGTYAHHLVFYDSGGTVRSWMTQTRLYLYDHANGGYFDVRTESSTTIYGVNEIFMETYGSDEPTIEPDTAGTGKVGTATYYWNEINYKELIDRGCLGAFDSGATLPDGRRVSDVEAIKAIKVLPGEKTPYGKPRLDYSTFPVECQRPAPIAEKDTEWRTRDGTKLVREGEKLGEDGIDLSALVSLVLGAIKELDARLSALEDRG